MEKDPTHIKQANSVIMPSSSVSDKRMFDTIQVKKK